jgi:phytoene/squalene synthetase
MYKQPDQQPPDHPVLQLIWTHLNASKSGAALNQRWFERVIEARFEDMMNVQPQNMDELEQYAERASSSLIYLTQDAMGLEDDTVRRAGSHVGVATGLVTLLRGTYHHVHANKQWYLPADLCAAKGLDMDSIAHGVVDERQQHALADIVYEVAAQAHAHLDAGAKLLAQVQPSRERTRALYSLLPAVKTKLVLEVLQKERFDVMNPELLQRSGPQQLRHQFQLLKATWTGKFM